MGIADAETIAAISAVFHTSKEYETFYKKFGPELSGFSGIWNLCAKMGMAFVEVEHELLPDWDGQWIDALDDFVNSIYTKAFTMKDVTFINEELIQIAKNSINKVMKE